MSLPVTRYALDPTGTNPDNLVSGEVHTLSTREIRAVSPTYTPYFTESLIIYDHNTDQLLIRGQDYECVGLLQEATLKFGQEIAELILIKNQSVSSQVRISYQVLGGLYQNDTSVIVNIYETYLNDNRGVEWTNVFNKPLTYPPSLHNHLIQDVYGFEPIVVALERIRNAIALSDMPAYEVLVAWVKERTMIATELEIRDGTPSERLISLERLIFALDKFNFNALTITPSSTILEQRTNLNIKVASTNLPDNTVLYWTIENISTLDSDFLGVSGLFNVVGNKGEFNVHLRDNQYTEEAEQFRILIRKNSPDGFVMAKSAIITIQAHKGYTGAQLKLGCCLLNPSMPISARSRFYIRSRSL